MTEAGSPGRSTTEERGAIALFATTTRRLWVFTGLAFVSALLVAGAFALFAEQVRLAEKRQMATRVAAEYAHSLQEQMDRGISATFAIAAVLRQGGGRIDNFQRLAQQMLPLYPGVSSLQLAPDGIISDVVPMAGNEKAVGHNLLQDPKRNKEAFAAVASRRLTLAGPFELVQGGVAVIGRLPIFLSEESAPERFWGFATALIRIDDLLRASRLNALRSEGYRFELWRLHPDTRERHVFAASLGERVERPVSHTFEVPNGSWTLSVEPSAGWMELSLILLEAGVALAFAIMVGMLTYVVLEQPIILRREVDARTRALAEQKRVLEEEIAERRRRERQVEYLNRLYLMLSETNHAIVKQGGRDALFAEICRIATDLGGFRAAWIAELSEEGDRLRLLAGSGEAAGLTGSADLERGAVGCLERIEADPSRNCLCSGCLAPGQRPPWCAGGGDAACMTRPLRVEGRVIGVFGLRAGAEDFPDNRAHDLVTEMTADLCYGLENLAREERRREVERSLRELNENLEHRIEARTLELSRVNHDLEAFAYSVSHDLRAPLRAINGFASLINNNERGALSEESRGMLDRLMHNTIKMGTLIDDILEFSRLGRARIEAREVDLHALADEVCEEMREAHPGVEIVCQALPMVSGDLILLRQVFANLLDNAVKFSSKREHPRVEIGLDEHQGSRAVFVRDNGAGFDMRYADKLFGVFQRLHNERDYSGTGVGLAIVKRIIERHGGKVWAQGEPDGGAIFWFSLPGL